MTIKWYKEHSKWKNKSYIPQTGDIIFFDWNGDNAGSGLLNASQYLEQYMELIRVNLRSQLNNIDMEQKDGSIVNLGEKYGEKYMNKKGN